MKKLVCIPLIATLFACSTATKPKAAHSTQVTKDTTVTVKTAVLVKDTLKQTSAPDENSNASKLIGLWIGKGDENVSFKVTKESFYYPDHSAYYKYTITGDSVKVKYEDGPLIFGVAFKGRDTLIMNGIYGTDTFFRKK
ncbi:hypothetical protein FFF34_014235 [Inquilinus sp. KBS0705]|nr:hypothetical protein FFF34_014235 [Inquilinus sp. KBS0705]